MKLNPTTNNNGNKQKINEKFDYRVNETLSLVVDVLCANFGGDCKFLVS